MSAHIFQIFSDEATRQNADPGFASLACTVSFTPEWGEYAAIRQFFLTTPLDEDAQYGFLSADFTERTGLSAQVVHAFIDANPGKEAYTFSPSFPDSVCYLNVFEQGNSLHPGFIEVAEAYLREIPLHVNLRLQPMDLRSTVYGNYIVAKPSFWRTWFALTEKLFDLYELKQEPFKTRVESVAVGGSVVGIRLLLIERIASLVLMLCPEIDVAAYDAATLPSADPAYRPYECQMASLEQLKTSFLETEDRQKLEDFYKLRGSVLQAGGEVKRLSRARDGFLGTPLVASPDMLYVCFTHVPPPFEFPSNVSMLYLGEAQGPGKANLRDLAPEWEPYHPQLGSLAGCFALKNYILENQLQIRQVGMCQYRKFISTHKVGGVPAENYPVMDVVVRKSLSCEALAESMSPGTRDFLLGRPARFDGGYFYQYQVCHVPQDLLRFAAAALELGVLQHDEATAFLAEQIFMPGGVEFGVFPTDFWIEAISSIEAVVRACFALYPGKREGYQARAWAFCAERLGSFLLLRHLTRTYGPGGWTQRFVGQMNLLTETQQTRYGGSQ